MLNRRRSLTAGAAIAASAIALPAWIGRSHAAEAGAPLPLLPLAEPGGGAVELLEAIAGTREFLAGLPTPVWGFGQSFLGPALRVRRGATARVDVLNRLDEPITSHWHGLHVPGAVDGGPHQEIAPGARWRPALEIEQPAATLWYHSHVHGRTGAHVMAGLAGLLIVDDPRAPESGLPQRWGIDDLGLVVQDRRFDRQGHFVYPGGGMMSAMLGFRGDRILVNGALRPQARVPAGVVRLRLLNACNARILDLHFDDGRALHLVGSDGGLLPRPQALRHLLLGSGERAEVLVDFGSGTPARLLSRPDGNGPMGGMGRGMMGRGMGGMGGMMAAEPVADAADGSFEVLRFEVDAARPAAVRRVPTAIAGAPVLELGTPERTRRFQLDSHGMMMGGMGGGMRGGMRGGMGGGMGMMTINGRAYDHHRIDARVRRGATELWEVRAGDMAHPFHVHGTSFRVLTRNGAAVDAAASGWKDTVLVDGSVELLMRFDHAADEHAPYMFHCHILEHEDAGMMGQFTVG